MGKITQFVVKSTQYEPIKIAPVFISGKTCPWILLVVVKKKNEFLE